MMPDPRDIQQYLESKTKLFKLKQDLVLFYAKQRPTSLVWLKQGLVQTRFDGRRPVDFHQPGLYFYEELMNEKEMSFSAKVSAGSEIWLMTRSEIENLLTVSV